ncbi:MAG: 2-phospho-L-lactate transferase [Acidimicrobiaceae bacterium]|nr:2-phospho-L-lactate transferase [Acidimicrobiaceae bacterium]HAB58336.1 2-phospho-L-lactate transferase [Acidimicrobiaceae bacterium]
MSHVVLAGGVGAARYLTGALETFDPTTVTGIVNVADDVVLHGLHVSPDLDTCTYTLAGAIDPDRGWGLVDETWQAMAELGRYGGANWFSLGDRDLGTHLYRTARLHDGATLTEVTAEISSAWGLTCRLLPVTDDRIETRVGLTDDREVGFQEYFVGMQHSVEVTAVRFAGAEQARLSSTAAEAITGADALVIAPSNPIVSIGPLLAVPGLQKLIETRREHNVAVSPIIGGAALKGPADRMLRELGEESSVVGIAHRYRNLAAALVIDEVDRELASAVEDAGMRPIVMPTIMKHPGVAAALARACHDIATGV